MQKNLSLLVRMFIALMVVVSLGAVFAQPISAQPPPLPHAFYGTLTINDEPAPIGTIVEARGEGVLIDVRGNPIITNEEGWYGSPDPLKPKLIVQGRIADGTIITFYVNGESTGQTCEWYTGEVDQVDLTVAPSTPPAAPVAEPVEVPAEPVVEPAEPIAEPAETIAEPAETVAGPLEAAATPTEAGSTTNWPVIGGIIAAVVVVALLVFFFVVRRRGAY